MNANKIAASLEEMLSSILEIEEFRLAYSKEKTEAIRSMAISAIERKIELMVRSYNRLRRLESNIALDEIIMFVKIANRLNASYVGKSSPELIISSIDSKLDKLKEEIIDTIDAYQKES